MNTSQARAMQTLAHALNTYDMRTPWYMRSRRQGHCLIFTVPWWGLPFKMIEEGWQAMARVWRERGKW